MIRDILNLRSGKNVAYEYINENLIMVTGEDAKSDGQTYLSFHTGPTFKVGRVSSFRGLEKRVIAISPDYEYDTLSRYEMVLEDA